MYYYSCERGKEQYRRRESGLLSGNDYCHYSFFNTEKKLILMPY